MNRFIAAFAIALLSSVAQGNPALSQWYGPYEYKVTPSGGLADDPKFLDDGVWEKYDFPLVDAELDITTYWQSDQLYGLPENGSQWTLVWKDPVANQVYDAYTLTYVAVTNCLVGDDGWQACTAIHPKGVVGATYATIRLPYKFTCLPVKPWSFVGSTPDGTAADMPFTPVRYRVNVWGPSATSPIQPHIPETDGGALYMTWPEMGPETATVSALVTDDQGCGKLLKDVSVDIQANVTGGAGHAHFTWDDGTGRFTNEGGTAADPRNITATHIQDQTDDTGKVVFHYTAGEFGVVEQMLAKARQEAVSEKDGESSSLSLQSFDIRYPWLVELPDAPADGTYVLAYTATGCPHDPQAHWLNYGMRAATTALAARYKQEYGAALSFNDGSLPYGGLIDNAHMLGRNAACHSSHRRGIDVDVNHSDGDPAVDEDLLLTVGHTKEGKAVTRLDLLDGCSAIPSYFLIAT